jgi:broad specificity phosphatase PhoE
MHIILCRHGETQWTLEGKHTSFTDLSLTKKGEEQARLLGKRLKECTYDLVYSSPLKRAFETCTLAHLPQPIVLEPNAVEWNYGEFEGLTTLEIQKKHPQWNLFFDGAPNGETPSQVGKRADLLIEKWSHLGKNIVLFSHGHFLRVLASRWIGLEAKDARLFGLKVGSLSLLGFERTQKVIESWNFE